MDISFRIVPGELLQQFCACRGIGGNFLDQFLNIIRFPFDEAQQADILLIVQELMEQTVAIVSCR